MIGPPSVTPNWCCWKSGSSREREVLRIGRERVVLAEVVQRPVQLVGAALGDDVDESAARAAELGVGALRDHDHLAHGVEIERERRALSAALLAEERIVEVGAIDGDVVVDAALSADAEHITVGTLRDRDVRRERREVEIVAPVVGKPAHDFRRAAASPRRSSFDRSVSVRGQSRPRASSPSARERAELRSPVRD